MRSFELLQDDSVNIFINVLVDKKEKSIAEGCRLQIPPSKIIQCFENKCEMEKN